VARAGGREGGASSLEEVDDQAEEWGDEEEEEGDGQGDEWSGEESDDEEGAADAASSYSPNPNPETLNPKPVHLIITMIWWIRTSRLPIKNVLCLGRDDCGDWDEGALVAPATAALLVRYFFFFTLVSGPRSLSLRLSGLEPRVG